jgi:hypothetical protein
MKTGGRFLGGLFLTVMASHAMAFKVEDGKEQGFAIFNINTSAPITVLNGLSPQQAIDKWCPGGKVTEVNLARTQAYLQLETSVQIVFIIPESGCPKKR